MVRPMLSASCEDLRKLIFPLITSPKLDGIRALITDIGLVSRNGKLIRNLQTYKMYSDKNLIGLDGELIVGSSTSPTCFRDTTSGIMSIEGIPEVQFIVFDDFSNESNSYLDRFNTLSKRILDSEKSFMKISPMRIIYTLEELIKYEEEILNIGYEGVMVRYPAAPYKFGRSTLREGGLIKIKRFQDAEARVVGFEPLYHNSNPKELNELGYSKHNHCQEGMIPLNKLGKFVVSDVETGVEFSVGSGMTDYDRIDFWNNRDNLIGKLIKYKHFPVGVKDKPRFPTFLGFREDL